MSKPVKELIRKQITGRLEGVTAVAVVDLTGVDANATNEIRSRLTEKDIRLSVVKNSLAKQAFKDVGLEAAIGLLVGPCALAWGADSIVSVVRELRDISKDIKELGLKGALLDGDVFDAGRMEELANFPTREEAIAQALQAVLSPGASLASCLIAPGGAIAALLETIEEQAEGSSDDAAAEEAPAAEVAAEEAPTEEAPAEETAAENAPAEGDEEPAES
ncbi:MAG: 50S ribosomal protein L10 [Planctomycetota bacterium]|jgi:large subunit ribosomal protein L10